MYTCFDANSFHELCEGLGRLDPDLNAILLMYGYPPLWTRTPSFATLIHIILEQQVSLASAKAAMQKLESRLGTVTPESLIALTDADLKDCYFSRQKTGYARHLANALLSKRLDLEKLQYAPDAMVRQELKTIPGIGDWTVDVYLMMALHRLDCFPLGDIALVKSLHESKRLPAAIPKDAINAMALQWAPHRTIAAFLLWHGYLSRRKKDSS